MPIISLYHGSPEPDIIPMIGKGNPNNDYGLGFYCTQDPEIAKEWACRNNTDGYVYEYILNTDSLKILNLDKEPYNILHKLSVFISHRKIDLFKNRFERYTDYFKAEFNVDIEPYDVIIGSRADDSSYTIIRSFLNNSVTLEVFKKSLNLGDLGQQIVVRTPESFGRLRFVRRMNAFAKDYYPRYSDRNKKAIDEFHGLCIEPRDARGVFAEDIVFEKWEEFDARLY